MTKIDFILGLVNEKNISNQTIFQKYWIEINKLNSLT